MDKAGIKQKGLFLSLSTSSSFEDADDDNVDDSTIVFVNGHFYWL